MLEDYGITVGQFELWKENFDDLPFMVRDRDTMEKLDNDLFER